MDSQSIANLIEPLRSRMAQAILIRENLSVLVLIRYEGQALLVGYLRARTGSQTLKNSLPVLSLLPQALLQVLLVPFIER